MTLRTAATVVRGVMMLMTCASALWFLSSDRSDDAFLGVVLTLLVACGLVVKAGRVRSYAMGLACVFTAPFLGSVSGPLFDQATIGYCDSVLEPIEPGHARWMTLRRAPTSDVLTVRQQRIPVIGVLGLAGLACLAASLATGRASVRGGGGRRTPAQRHP